MARLLLIAAALLVGFQDPPTPKSPDSQDPDFVGPIQFNDPKTGEIVLEFSGLGRDFDLQQGSGLIQQARVKLYTKATENEPTHTIHLFAARCNAENLGRGEASGQGLLRFSGGLRVFMDNNVRLWTSEGVFDVKSHVLHCPNTTRLVHFTWPVPPRLDLASTMVYLDPQEMEWLQRFGAPAPDFELVGEDFALDVNTQVFTAGRKGRIRVIGRPGDAFRPPRKKPRPVSSDPTELRSEGPLRLENLGAPNPESWTTLRVTAERNVVVEQLTKGATRRTHSDSASIYIGVPPKMDGEAKAQALSAVLKGGVRIEESGVFSATADRLEWNHQDGLLRLTGAPRVEVTHGAQRLQAREVVVDNQVVDFKGDIVASFLPARDAPAAGDKSGLMTLNPGELRMRTNATGRPVAIHARNGVKITTGGDAAGEDALEVDASEFEWDLVSGEGSIRGAPFARIQEGANIVVAPLVTFRGVNFEKSYMVIKGPKHLKFFTESKPPDNPGFAMLDAVFGLPGLQKRPELREPTLNASASLLEAAFGMPGLQGIPGRRDSFMDLVASCEGDAILDQEANVVKLVDRCTVRAQDSTLTADRLFVFLIKGKGVRPSFDRVIGLGRVRASHDQGPGGGTIQIDGETLELREDPLLGSNGERTVRVVGFPEGRGLMGGSEEFHFGWLEFNLKTKAFSMGPGWGRLGF